MIALYSNKKTKKKTIRNNRPQYNCCCDSLEYDKNKCILYFLYDYPKMTNQNYKNKGREI